MVTAHSGAESKRSSLPSAMYSLAELAALLDISYTKAHELAQRDALPVPALQIGRTWKFPKRAVDRLLGLDVETPDAA